MRSPGLQPVFAHLDGVDAAQDEARRVAEGATGWDRELVGRVVEALSVLRTVRVVVESRDPAPPAQLTLWGGR